MPRKKSTPDNAVQPTLLYEQCRTVSFIAIEPPIGNTPLHFQLDATIQTDIEAGLVIVLIVMEASSERRMETDGEDSEQAALIRFAITTENRFRITHLREVITQSEGAIILPTWMMMTMITTSVGTSRGVLLSKLAGTPYDGGQLPIFGLRNFMDDPRATSIPIHGI
ncbi:MAG: hypothetical protein ABIR47_01870 [Candidatus Kapaibacterium sp.]